MGLVEGVDELFEIVGVLLLLCFLLRCGGSVGVYCGGGWWLFFGVWVCWWWCGFFGDGWIEFFDVGV